MEEDIKKDLKEIKEEIEEKEKSQEESEEETQEEVSEVEEKPDVTPEKAEALVEKLVKPEEEEEKEEPKEKRLPKFTPKELIFISGSIFIFILILLGVWIGFKLIKGDVGKEKIDKEVKTLSESEVVIPEGTAFKKFSKIVIVSEEKKEEFPYKLELKNFLIPLGVKEFLSLDVVLYFDNNTSTKELSENELGFREKLYSYFKNIPLDVWQNTEKVKQLEDKIKENLKKDNIKPVPQKVRIEGTILKG